MKLLQTISTFTSLILIIFFLVFRKRNNDRRFRALFIYVIFSLTFDVLGRIHQLSDVRFYLYSAFTLIEFFVFSYFLYQSFKQTSFRHLLIAFFALFTFVFVYSVLYNSNMGFDFLTASLAGFMIIIFCILFFYEQMKNPEISFIYESKSFWVISAFFIFMSATFFLFMSMGTLSFSQDQKNILWSLNHIANILKNVLFAIAFYKPLSMLIDMSIYKSSRSGTLSS